MSKFINKVLAEEQDCYSNSGRGTWKIKRELSFQSDIAYNYWIKQGKSTDDATKLSVITVPVDFETDFMSVPPEVPNAGILSKSRRAGAVHDFLYTKPHIIPDRETCDSILKEMFIEDVTESGGAVTEEQKLLLHTEADLVYAGVRLGGSSHWN